MHMLGELLACLTNYQRVQEKMKAALLLLLIILMIPLPGAADALAEPSWFPFTYPCDTEWIEGERYYCETLYSKADLLSVEDGEPLMIKARRFCRMEGGAFTAIQQDGERGYLADDGDYEPNQIYGLSI